MKALIIEDDEDKLADLLYVLHSNFDSLSVDVARSFGSGLRKAVQSCSETAFILLDMSMPTFEVSRDEPTGGAPESFAGRELLAQMKLRGINVPVIVVTMFDVFGERPETISIGELTEQLKGQYSPPFSGLVYYNSREEGWRGELVKAIKTAIHGVL